MKSKDQIADVFTKASIKVWFNKFKSWSQLRTPEEVEIQ